MEEIYSEKVLIRYLYKESDLFERLEIENAIETNKKVRTIFMEMNKIFDLLPKVAFVPSDKTINRILQASKHTTIQA
jgi:hypothetical protein